MIEKRIDERSRRIARRGMNDHSLGLVHDDEIVVLVNNVERNIFGLGTVGRRRGKCDAIE